MVGRFSVFFLQPACNLSLFLQERQTDTLPKQISSVTCLAFLAVSLCELAVKYVFYSVGEKKASNYAFFALKDQ